MSPRSGMSVNARGQDIGLAPFIKPQPTFHRHPATRRVLSDLPVQGTYHPAISYTHPPALSYGWRPLGFVNNPRYSAAERYPPVQRTIQAEPMELTFDDCFIEDSENMLNDSKPSRGFPMCPQAMPTSFSFRPWPHDSHHQAPSLPQASLLPIKVESNPDVPPPTLPTPAVLSTEVDVSKYEAVQHRDWLEAYPDYVGLSSASPDTLDSSPRFEDIDSFANNTTRAGLNEWSIGPHNGTQPARYQSFASSYTDEGTSASPALSYHGFNNSTTAAPWSASMFGLPDVVPPSRYQPSGRSLQPVTAALQEIERPISQRSGSVQSVVPTMQSRHIDEEDKGYVNRRDKMLLDLRRKGHSYKEIKRLGRFKEAESTLRGRLRTLTKEKSERVRKPKWNRHDIELLQDAVEHFVAESSSSSRKRKPFRKLPWKKISEWMKEQGSSYLFAPATCARKWEEI